MRLYRSAYWLAVLKWKSRRWRLILQVFAGDFAVGFAAAVTAFRAATDRALGVRQALLSSTIVAWVLDHPAFGVRQKHLQPHIQANGRMLACRALMRALRMHNALLVLWRRLTHDQRVPVVISPQDQMGRDRCSLQRAMQLDLEQASQFGGDVQMRPVRPVVIQPDIAMRFVLAQLDAVPAVGCLEAGEA